MGLIGVNMKLQTLRAYNPSASGGFSDGIDYNEVGDPDPSVVGSDDNGPPVDPKQQPPVDPKQQPSFPELMGEIVEEGNQVVRKLRDAADVVEVLRHGDDDEDTDGDEQNDDLPWNDDASVHGAIPVDPASVDPTSVVPDNTPIDDMSEELYWAEVRLAGSMAAVERERITLEAEIQKHKEAVQKADGKLKKCEAGLHEAKESHKSATERLLGLARKLVEITKEKKLPTEEELVRLEAGPDDGWRLASTVELLTKAKIKGLSNKKIELLAEHAPTLGDLEDLRGLASKECVPYAKKLPKGLGGKVADAIEEVQEEYLREWTQRQGDPARAKLADDLLAECRELVAEWNAADCVPKESDDEHLHAGHTAFCEGIKFTEFLSDDREKAKQWITGWVMAERGKQLASVAVEE